MSAAGLDSSGVQILAQLRRPSWDPAGLSPAGVHVKLITLPKPNKFNARLIILTIHLVHTIPPYCLESLLKDWSWLEHLGSDVSWPHDQNSKSAKPCKTLSRLKDILAYFVDISTSFPSSDCLLGLPSINPLTEAASSF
ncbi:hypothetical protein PtA15_6A214 [Puccinia triticina]|uniref:Uncharacterized protein n=1 Tax=Puccinia triticina TaxID=208348 RepID=A0ABY7CN80_9BASI|nr:uncharacterized protein PtA15_6A214 [Puccinia triticina]WAQ85586.1 hypothetical protein PtA15_6A214 [Puccinia triticina]